MLCSILESLQFRPLTLHEQLFMFFQVSKLLLGGVCSLEKKKVKELFNLTWPTFIAHKPRVYIRSKRRNPKNLIPRG